MAEDVARIARQERWPKPQKPPALNAVSSPTAQLERPERISAIDLARGFAIALMILSHGVKGLLSFEQIPDWGLVPIHLITKFSSSLFILVFGISLAVAYVPHVRLPDWPAKRTKLLVRGLVILFWYKVLTIVEMTPLYSRQEILDTLMYRAFPVYVEILDFYAIALLWVPFFLPVWARFPLAARLASPVALGALAVGLYHSGLWSAGFWNAQVAETIQALTVEHERHYAWGQLSRGPLILLGLLLGGWLLRVGPSLGRRLFAAGALVGSSFALLGAYAWLTRDAFREELFAIARNEGKHPPELHFMLFSIGGALLILALCVLGGGRLARVLRPISLIGTNPLQSFVFHIFVLFVFYRYLFGYWHSVSYPFALALTLALILMTALWVKITRWVRSHS